MPKSPVHAAVTALAVLGIAAASPPAVHRVASPAGPFPPAVTAMLPNGAIVASQTSADTPLVGIDVFLPVGAVQQSPEKSGVAAVSAAIVLATPVERDATLSDVAAGLGASATYTIDPLDTRFSFECKASDAPRLLSDFAAAIKSPDLARFASVRGAAMQAANDAIRDPALTAFAMIRQAQFAGTGYARLDGGVPTALAGLSPSDVAAFSVRFRHGAGAVAALSGNVTPEAVAAAKSALAGFSAAAAPRTPTPAGSTRTREVVAHRDVAAPWVAVGYAAPSQFAADFPTMLVIEMLLGRGGDVHAFSVGSETASPSDFAGGYYQYEAQPGLLIEFFNGANVDRDLHSLDDGIVRLRATPLPSDLLAHAKAAASGAFLTSVTTLDDESWLLGRSALSPDGVGFENVLLARIGGVTAADVQRVAKKYLGSQTIAVVLPNGSGQ